MKLFLIRHGETTGDREDRYGGWYDDHLTEHGREQMMATAQRLAGKGIEVLYCSPLIRTREAAAIIESAINIPVEYMDSLKERYFGVLTGLTEEEAKQKYPEAVARHQNPLNTDPEGEGYDDFCNRVMHAIRSITEKEYNTVGIVTHGGPIKCVLRALGKDAPDKLADGAIIELEF
ncbi:histidine phosphatase family protein [Candidatus Uhrbacteria bacterium]|nr:histidine phosphatase family protein [Candidatus Uhrbacteria bacterium]